MRLFSTQSQLFSSSDTSKKTSPVVGAFAGSDVPLFDTGELLSQIIHTMEDESTVEVGVFGSRATIAKYHEFGAPRANIPERSFMRTAFVENEQKIKKIIKDEMKK